MSDDDRDTVADVLAEAYPEPKHCAMLAMLEADAEPGDLDYDDWVKPMRMTDGRVCLKADLGDMGCVIFMMMKGTLVSMWDDGVVGGNQNEVEEYLKNNLDRDDVDVVPVLREDTPFGSDNE